MPEYTAGFKKQMVKKLVTPGGESARTLAARVGVSQSSLSRWLREACTVVSVTNPTGSKKWTWEEKLRVVVGATKIDDKALGELLRREGLHEEQLRQWRADAEAALSERPKRGQKASREAKRIRELEREVRRKDKALAEASALLILKKKAAAIWGDEDDDTTPESES